MRMENGKTDKWAKIGKIGKTGKTVKPAGAKEMVRMLKHTGPNIDAMVKW